MKIINLIHQCTVHNCATSFGEHFFSAVMTDKVHIRGTFLALPPLGLSLWCIAKHQGTTQFVLRAIHSPEITCYTIICNSFTKTGNKSSAESPSQGAGLNYNRLSYGLFADRPDMKIKIIISPNATMDRTVLFDKMAEDALSPLTSSRLRGPNQYAVVGMNSSSLSGINNSNLYVTQKASNLACWQPTKKLWITD